MSTTALINTTDAHGGRRLHQIRRSSTQSALVAVLGWLGRADLSLGAVVAESLTDPSPKGLGAAPVPPEKFQRAGDLDGFQALYQIQLGPCGHHQIFVLERGDDADQWAVTFTAFFPDSTAEAQER